jgi:CRP-like cAMP-binding protein
VLAMLDIPQFLQDAHARSQAAARVIFERFAASGERLRMPAGANLLDRHESAYAYVRTGVFKFSCGGKLVRLYCEGDLLITDGRVALEGCRVEASFASEITLIPRDALIGHLGTEPALLAQWLEFVELESQVMHVLCSLYARSDVQPRVTIHNFDAGDAILEQGQEASEIYELVEGEASVSVEGHVVGHIKPGELFGEMSFLTEQPCVGTVKALVPCLVQGIKREDFSRMVQVRPHLMISLARTLATRVAELDAKLSKLGRR